MSGTSWQRGLAGKLSRPENDKCGCAEFSGSPYCCNGHIFISEGDDSDVMHVLWADAQEFETVRFAGLAGNHFLLHCYGDRYVVYLDGNRVRIYYGSKRIDGDEIEIDSTVPGVATLAIPTSAFGRIPSLMIAAVDVHGRLRIYYRDEKVFESVGLGDVWGPSSVRGIVPKGTALFTDTDPATNVVTQYAIVEGKIHEIAYRYGLWLNYCETFACILAEEKDSTGKPVPGYVFWFDGEAWEIDYKIVPDISMSRIFYRDEREIKLSDGNRTYVCLTTGEIVGGVLDSQTAYRCGSLYIDGIPRPTYTAEPVDHPDNADSWMIEGLYRLFAVPNPLPGNDRIVGVCEHGVFVRKSATVVELRTGFDENDSPLCTVDIAPFGAVTERGTYSIVSVTDSTPVYSVFDRCCGKEHSIQIKASLTYQDGAWPVTHTESWTFYFDESWQVLADGSGPPSYQRSVAGHRLSVDGLKNCDGELLAPASPEIWSFARGYDGSRYGDDCSVIDSDKRVVDVTTIYRNSEWIRLKGDSKNGDHMRFCGTFLRYVYPGETACIYDGIEKINETLGRHAFTCCDDHRMFCVTFPDGVSVPDRETGDPKRLLHVFDSVFGYKTFKFKAPVAS